MFTFVVADVRGDRLPVAAPQSVENLGRTILAGNDDVILVGESGLTGLTAGENFVGEVFGDRPVVDVASLVSVLLCIFRKDKNEKVFFNNNSRRALFQK